MDIQLASQASASPLKSTGAKPSGSTRPPYLAFKPCNNRCCWRHHCDKYCYSIRFGGYLRACPRRRRTAIAERGPRRQASRPSQEPRRFSLSIALYRSFIKWYTNSSEDLCTCLNKYVAAVSKTRFAVGGGGWSNHDCDSSNDGKDSDHDGVETEDWMMM